MNEIVAPFASDAHVPSEISELQQFFVSHQADVSSSSFSQYIEGAKLNQMWVERNFVKVATWFQRNYDNIPSKASVTSQFEVNLEIVRPGSVDVVSGESVDMSCNLEEALEIVDGVCRFQSEMVSRSCRL